MVIQPSRSPQTVIQPSRSPQVVPPRQPTAPARKGSDELSPNAGFDFFS